LLVLLAGCKQDKEPDPHSLAALEAEGPPHTPDCRSWDAAAFAGLEPLSGGPHVAAFEQIWLSRQEIVVLDLAALEAVTYE